MTPQQKAQELYYAMAIDSWIHAKYAAIICVDEIIKANPAIPKTVKGTARNNFALQLAIESQVPYWQQVKEELQKM